jgi:hypothetical protein
MTTEIITLEFAAFRKAIRKAGGGSVSQLPTATDHVAAFSFLGEAPPPVVDVRSYTGATLAELVETIAAASHSATHAWVSHPVRRDICKHETQWYCYAAIR